jgi:hypothetical protein
MEDQEEKNRIMIEQELEKMAKEGDEIAERLGPEIRNRMIKAENAGLGYAKTLFATGIVSAGLLLNHYFGFFNSHYPGDFKEGIALSIAGGGISAFIPSIIICSIMKKRAYKKLEKEFPNKVTDMQRFRELTNSYAFLRAASNPPG